MRARAAQLKKGDNGESHPLQAPVGLSPMADDTGTRHSARLPIDFAPYLELLTRTAAVRRASSDETRPPPPPLLERFGLRADAWASSMRQHQLATCTALGRLDALDAEANRRGKAWLHQEGTTR